LTVAKGDIVKMVDDHTHVVTRGEWFRVLDLSESKVYGPVAEMQRVEHFPGPDFPRGSLGHYRCVPVDWLKTSEARTRDWNEAVT
jgi:hypothetical protein